ncbi:MAG: peptidoglycan bridge formation glycyltransferase FemA/FemB family protein [Candidatus Shapirobacteria bacterium]|nr:peptidoglycan bridge formation glycyltransferase FemA/FemB family protein [Candidatus Shapirobacteria bacterium]
MLVREVFEEEKEQFNRMAIHPLQSWEWGEFRKKTGLKVIRLGVFDNRKLISSFQLTVHPLPKTNYSILYFPRGPQPDKLMIASLQKIGQQEKAIFIKMEPNIKKDTKTEQFLLENGCQKGKSLFTKYSFQLNLQQTEEELLAKMKPKTRYNIRVSQKHDVKISEDNSPQAFEKYLELTNETTKRQKFYAHSANYHRKMWSFLQPSGIAHLFKAQYENQTLVTDIFFIFNQVLYYPYGASTREYKEVMAPYGLFWEVIKFGQKMDCKIFDMWGSPGPNPDPNDPWIGFHRFKEGFGGELIEFIGTYDLVLNPLLYKLFNLADRLRWIFLKSKSSVF